MPYAADSCMPPIVMVEALRLTAVNEDFVDPNLDSYPRTSCGSGENLRRIQTMARNQRKVGRRFEGTTVNFLDRRLLVFEEDCPTLFARGDGGWGRPGLTSWSLVTRSGDGGTPTFCFDWPGTKPARKPTTAPTLSLTLNPPPSASPLPHISIRRESFGFGGEDPRLFVPGLPQQVLHPFVGIGGPSSMERYTVWVMALAEMCRVSPARGSSWRVERFR
jgi:hypothetical protein